MNIIGIEIKLLACENPKEEINWRFTGEIEFSGGSYVNKIRSSLKALTGDLCECGSITGGGCIVYHGFHSGSFSWYKNGQNRGLSLCQNLIRKSVLIQDKCGRCEKIMEVVISEKQSFIKKYGFCKTNNPDLVECINLIRRDKSLSISAAKNLIQLFLIKSITKTVLNHEKENKKR